MMKKEEAKKQIVPNLFGINDRILFQQQSNANRSRSGSNSIPPPPQLYHKLSDDEDDESSNLGILTPNAHGFTLCASVENEIAKTKKSKTTRNISSYSQLVQVPPRIQKYAQSNYLPFAQTMFDKSQNADSQSICSSDNNECLYLLQLTRLAADCGVNTLRQIFSPIKANLQSVHFVDDDKTAILRFYDEESLQKAMNFAKRFKWHSKQVSNSAYLRNFDQQSIWQYQESNKWRAHDSEMGKLIDEIPWLKMSKLIIQHGSRQYLVEKYNESQGRQTNLRTFNQRMIRRITIHCWAPKTNQTLRIKAMPKIPVQSGGYYDSYIYGPHIAANQMTLNDDISIDEVVKEESVPNILKHGLDVNAQEFTPSPKAKEKEDAIQITVDESSNENWLVEGVDDPGFELFAEKIGTDRLSGVWYYDDKKKKRKAQKGKVIMKKELNLFYIPDVMDAEDIFEKGFDANQSNEFGGNQFTYYRSIRKAMRQYDEEEGEADDDGNVKIFLCDVWLSELQQKELKKKGFVNICDAEQIELRYCASLNYQILKKQIA